MSTINLATLAEIFADESKAFAFLEKLRWGDTPTCPHCQCKEAYKLTPKVESKRSLRPGVYKCKDCRKQFTVRIGTIFEESKIPLTKWLMALHLMTVSKKGVSAKQIERQIGVTYKTAWFLCHRIREAMRQEPLGSLLGGAGKTVEVDETYVGGKPRKGSKVPSKRGRGTKKSAVAVLVERDGNVRAKPVKKVTAKELKKYIKENVSTASKVVTDDFKSYKKLDEDFQDHSVVNHSKGIFLNDENEHTNTAESFNSLIKRGHYGIYHSFSKTHLERYCDEYAFRWNTRKISDGDRFVKLIESTQGKRLRYTK